MQQLEPCDPVFVFGMNTYVGKSCISAVAECLTLSTTNSSSFCDCRTSQILLSNSASFRGHCEQTTGSWVVCAVHILLAIFCLPIFIRLLTIMRTNSARFELLRDALWLSAVATACLVVRCLSVSIQTATPHGAGLSISSSLFAISTVCLFFAFTMSVVIYVLIVISATTQLHTGELIQAPGRKSLRRTSFFQSLAFAILSAVLTGVPYLLGLYIITHAILAGVGLTIVVLFVVAAHRLSHFLREFQAHISHAFHLLQQTVLGILACVTVFTLSACVYTTCQYVGHSSPAKFHVTSIGCCIALIFEYTSMIVVQLCLVHVASVVTKSNPALQSHNTQAAQHSTANSQNSVAKTAQHQRKDSTGKDFGAVVVFLDDAL